MIYPVWGICAVSQDLVVNESFKVLKNDQEQSVHSHQPGQEVIPGLLLSRPEWKLGAGGGRVSAEEGFDLDQGLEIRVRAVPASRIERDSVRARPQEAGVRLRHD